MDDLDRYSRQVLFPDLGRDGQRKLLSSDVVLCGCGALGSVLASSLVRGGLGRLRIIDRDFVETNNLQRQILFDEQDVADMVPKAEAAARKLRHVNSTVEIDAVVADVDHKNVLDLVDGADLILDGTDNFETRFLLNEAAIKTATPWIYGACLAAGGLVMAIVPGQTPCLRCVFGSAPAPGMSPTCETAGILAPTVMVVASLEYVEALKVLAGRTDKLHGDLVAVDVWEPSLDRLRVGSLAQRGPCPTCKDADFPYLEARVGARAQRLCGRNAVQLTHRVGADVSLKDLAGRLKSVGKVLYNDFLLRFNVDEHEVTVFADGRAIVKGTEDETEARALYAKYIGT